MIRYQDDRIMKTLSDAGIRNVSSVYWNLPTAALYEETVRRREGLVAHRGPLVVKTGTHTGRAAQDKFVVRDATTETKVHWGKVNQPLDPAAFDALHARVCAYFQGRDVFVQDCYAGADATHRLPIRVVTETAWHSLFARNMFIRPKGDDERANHRPDFTVIHAPGFQAVPTVDQTRSNCFIVLNLTKKVILIGGTAYAGEIKKSIFTVMNWLLPQKGVMSMHCSANVGRGGDAALLFGLSGTGKTTLSADPERALVGDDEHGWSDAGVFNIEGGCYAKVIRLSPTAEPEIYATTEMFGTVLENVAIDAVARRVNLDDDSFTENTRASYPLRSIPNIVPTGTAGQPRHILFLTADAFGVMPPVARLTPEQAMYHFLSGYTAKVAGTEAGVKEPTATFSACFGAPFMPLHPGVYAKLLGEKLEKTKAKVWLINTGWTGGPPGVGNRMSIAHTRAIVRAVLSGRLDDVRLTHDPVFNLGIPLAVPDVPTAVLSPRNTWKDQDTYDKQAWKVAGLFHQNFMQFVGGVTPEIANAGPNKAA
jgi:phosphoenolpyruvate carboxykinase (ATP)